MKRFKFDSRLLIVDSSGTAPDGEALSRRATLEYEQIKSIDHDVLRGAEIDMSKPELTKNKVLERFEQRRNQMLKEAGREVCLIQYTDTSGTMINRIVKTNGSFGIGPIAFWILEDRFDEGFYCNPEEIEQAESILNSVAEDGIEKASFRARKFMKEQSRNNVEAWYSEKFLPLEG